jgi:hypothetical protein
MISFLRSKPSSIASISSGDSLGEATNSILPPFLISPIMPFVNSTRADDEKNPTALL